MLVEQSEKADPDIPPFLPQRTWLKLAKDFRLSPREREIVLCIFEGVKECTIARRLDISPHTVHTYTRRLYRKLGASCRSELILSFFRGYVEKQRWRPSRSDTSGGLRALTPPSA